MATIRAQFHRLRPGVETAKRREVGSSVLQIFDGSGLIEINDIEYAVEHGDILAIPSWAAYSIKAATQMDVFHFSDHPIFERLGLARVHLDGNVD